MNFWRTLAICCVVFVTFQSCKDKLELNAPYKEIPTVYAVLNPSDTTHMIRINKVFLGEGDANQMAKVADSINYPANELVVTLERYLFNAKDKATKNGLMDIVFTESMVTTANGSFNTTQRVYVANASLFDDGEYRLTIRNKRTGNIFRSHATPVKPVSFFVFEPLSTPYTFPYNPNTDPKYYIDYSPITQPLPVNIKYATNEAASYQLILRYFFQDYFDDGNIGKDSMDYNAGTRYLRDAQKLGSTTITYVTHSFTGAGIYSFIGLEASKQRKSLIGRKFYRIDYIVYSATQEYLDYLEYLKPSLSISQNKPLYSNFDNSAALGIFTFRNTQRTAKQPSTVYVNSFSDHPSTCSYRFMNSNNQVGSCK